MGLESPVAYEDCSKLHCLVAQLRPQTQLGSGEQIHTHLHLLKQHQQHSETVTSQAFLSSFLFRLGQSPFLSR
ncbi:UNVERIFIED_CONTAM: hypothetical protein FKN15_034432 [Acipenser sinensis]